MNNYALFVMVDCEWVEVARLNAEHTAAAYRKAIETIPAVHRGLPFALRVVDGLVGIPGAALER